MASSEYAQLVDLITRRFSEMDQRFDQMDRRFDEVDQRFAAVAHQLGELGRRIDAVEGRVTALQQEMLGHFDEIYRRLEAARSGVPRDHAGAVPHRGAPD